MPIKILTVVGARPQFVKAAVVSREIMRRGSAEEVLVHTGQHFDDNMSSIFFEELGIPSPKYNLGIGGGTHGANTGRALEGLEAVIVSERPDWVLVYGDTDSTLAGALAAAKLNVPIAHVEAGLRSFNRRMPEEVNRILTDHVSTLLFAPSGVAVRNLAQEGISGDGVKMVGDVMFDAVKMFTGLAAGRSSIVADLGLLPKGYILATLHRKENTDDESRLRSILDGLRQADVPVILPLHPRTRNRIREFGLSHGEQVRVIDPVGYLDMMLLQRDARAIATDSGGMQKEAYFHDVPCVVLRDETEWVELIEIGVNRLAGSDAAVIAEALRAATPNGASAYGIYGDGDTAAKVVDSLIEASSR